MKIYFGKPFTTHVRSYKNNTDRKIAAKLLFKHGARVIVYRDKGAEFALMVTPDSNIPGIMW